MDDGSPEILTQQHMTGFGRQTAKGNIYILSLVDKYCHRNNIRLEKERKEKNTEMCQISKSARKLRFPSNSAFPISKIMSLFCLVSESHFLSVIANNRARTKERN